MIIAIIGYMILGGCLNQYGRPYLTNYLFPLDKNTTKTEVCNKCNILSDISYIHCNNCNRCHKEIDFRKCNLCNECIFYTKYNSHTKNICVHEFSNTF